eukprot:GHVR01156461.1.p2 GENE.GHVR01156461.1~~GHVR01156461.1.p2  ORF type:complete len:305 (-),score=158.81 GHVR01156461.1:168-1082(-)
MTHTHTHTQLIKFFIRLEHNSVLSDDLSHNINSDEFIASQYRREARGTATTIGETHTIGDTAAGVYIGVTESGWKGGRNNLHKELFINNNVNNNINNNNNNFSNIYTHTHTNTHTHTHTHLLSITDDGMTPLHIVAQVGPARLVTLLLECGADPTTVDSKHRVPYTLATHTHTRTAFINSRATLGESVWPWDKTGVPEPLSPEAKQKKKEKEKEKRRRHRERARQNKKDGHKKDGQSGVSDAPSEEEGVESSRVCVCDCCNHSLSNVITPLFYRMGYSYCCEECVHTHRRILAATAAEKRIEKN